MKDETDYILKCIVASKLQLCYWGWGCFEVLLC